MSPNATETPRTRRTLRDSNSNFGGQGFWLGHPWLSVSWQQWQAKTSSSGPIWYNCKWARCAKNQNKLQRCNYNRQGFMGATNHDKRMCEQQQTLQKRRGSLQEPGNVVCGQLGQQVVPFCHLLADSGITQSWASDCFDPTWSSEAKSVQRLPGLPISSKPGVRPCRHNWDEKNNCQMCLWWICPPHLTWWSSIDKPIFADKQTFYFQWRIIFFWPTNLREILSWKFAVCFQNLKWK